MSFTLSTAEWSPVIPGTKTSRFEAAQQMVELVAALGTEHADERLRQLSRLDVLTVGQLAALRGVSRQRLYIKLMQLGLPLPTRSRTVNGTLHPEYTAAILRACTVLGTHRNSLRADHIEGVRRAGTRALMLRLTGIDTRKGEVV